MAKKAKYEFLTTMGGKYFYRNGHAMRPTDIMLVCSSVFKGLQNKSEMLISLCSFRA
jgi:hypothetical protein